MTGRRCALALAVVGALLAPATAAWAGLADRIGATFGLIAGDFVRAFQPVEGLVAAVEGDRLYLDLGESTGVSAGQELTVFRKGEAFVHPYTGQTLGRYETILGHAQIVRVQERLSEAVFLPLPDRDSPRVEDGVRITRGRIRVGVTPVLDLTRSGADLRRVPYLLASVLDRSKRFQVADTLVVAELFTSGRARVEEFLVRPVRATAVGRSLEVAAWLVPVLLERRGVPYLDATWISAVTGKALLSRRQALVPESAVEEQRFPWEPRAED